MRIWLWLTRFFGAETVDFESFSKILNRPGGFRDPGEPEDYCLGFKVFDKDATGVIGVGQLRYSTSSDQVLHFPTDGS